MSRYHNINGNNVQFTAEEETVRDADEAQEAIDRQARIDAHTVIANNKTSGKIKLKDLGLSDGEITSLIN